MTKSDFSMQSVRTLFRLDLKSRYGISPDAGKLKKFAQFGNMLFFVLVYAVLVVGIYYLSNVFFPSKSVNTREDFTPMYGSLFIMRDSSWLRFYSVGW